MKYTPTPWEYKEWEYGSFGDSVGYIAQKGGTPEETIFVCSIDSESDAEYIVKCVNSHDALLEAAKIGRACAKKLLSAFDDEESPKYKLIKEAVEEIEKAIQVAEGK